MTLQNTSPRAAVRWNWAAIDAGLIAILISVSLFNFVRRGPTAWEWPAIDMAVLYERAIAPDFLTDDYFTNSVSASNPRHVFGYSVIALTRLLGADWFQVYFGLRTLLTTLTPALWFLVVLAAVNPTLQSDRHRWIARLFAVLAIGLVMNRKFATFFTIAWWPPLQIYAGAHPTALALSLLAIVLDLRLPGPWKWLSLLFWSAATLIHPAIGLLMLIFSALATLLNPGWSGRQLRGLLAVLPSALLISRLYQPENPLSTAEFIDVYVRSCHPFHYELAHFASSTKFPWWVNSLLICALLTTGGLAAQRLQRVEISRLAFLFLTAYLGCIVLQWVATDVWPSKLLVQIGPSRFSFAGYFFLTIIGAMLAAAVWPVSWDLPQRVQQIEARIHGWFHPAWVALSAAVVTILVAACCCPDWRQTARQPHAAFYDWAARHTRPDDVFHLPYMHPLHQSLPVVGQRAVFVSAGFPFREDDFREHQLRMSAGYGPFTRQAPNAGKPLHQLRNQRFRQFTSVDILALAEIRRLDYIVLETGQSSELHGISACYEDDSIVVFEVWKLREFQGLGAVEVPSPPAVTPE